MKKSLAKPENWQDFESLCKKLWGNIWQIPNKIKKNGRQGQDQSGVDVFGKPKSEKGYWGIQCKGKDDYSRAKLTIKEIDAEILKAKTFKPTLEVYILATTANKDSKIEEYVRLKDIENQEENSFEILLYCWEDIVDLIEENKEVFDWYIHGIGQIGIYDFRVLFNNLDEYLTLRPIYIKEITKYQQVHKSRFELISANLGYFDHSYLNNIAYPLYLNKINKSWCSFEIVMENIGSKVIEDWRFEIQFTDGIRKIYEGTMLFPSLSMTEFINNDKKSIKFRPYNDKPLIQKDNSHFETSVLIEHNASVIKAKWNLLARDFNLEGELEITVQPKFIEKIKYEEISYDEELPDEKIFISDHVVEKENKA